MDIIKYFFEEPVSLEVLGSEVDPRRREAETTAIEELSNLPGYYRGYLAGTDLDSGRIGLTALKDPDSFVLPLLQWLRQSSWMHADQGTGVISLEVVEVERVLRDPSDTALMVAVDEPISPELLQAARGSERRYTIEALRALMDVSNLVLIPEPAHHGFDWSLFSKRPIRQAVITAMKDFDGLAVRRFVLPYQSSRSEEKFYFEFWQLDHLPDYVEEL